MKGERIKKPRVPEIGTFGIITKVYHCDDPDLFKNSSGLSEADNGYIWFSQTEQKEFLLFQDELGKV